MRIKDERYSQTVETLKLDTPPPAPTSTAEDDIGRQNATKQVTCSSDQQTIEKTCCFVGMIGG